MSRRRVTYVNIHFGECRDFYCTITRSDNDGCVYTRKYWLHSITASSLGRLWRVYGIAL